MKIASRLNVIIVNFRTPELTKKCVTSIIRCGVAPAGSIIVVENASGDSSFEELQTSLPDDVRLVKAERNGGFGAGVNIGCAHSTSELLLILNPDTYFLDDSIKLALDEFDSNSKVGIVGLDLVNPDGSRQYSARRFYSLLDVFMRRVPFGSKFIPKTLLNRNLLIKEWAGGRPFDADWVMGTGFLIRRELFVRLGGMDESYFLYMEDVDLCARVWLAGHRVVAVPDSKLVHDHQRSSAASLFSWAAKMHLRSLGIFMAKFNVPFFRLPGVDGIKR